MSDQLFTLLKQLRSHDSSKISFDDTIAEISPYPSPGTSFLVETSYWTPAWDRLRCTVERWAIADGFDIVCVYEGNSWAVELERDGQDWHFVDKEPAIALLSAYLQAKTSQQNQAYEQTRAS